MNSPRPPRKVRLAVLERDGFRCIDCRRPKPLPESMLEVDHDRELQDGGDDLNDPTNLVTRCVPHHQAKTQERRMAREGTPVKQKAATAVLPDRPTFPFQVIAGACLGAMGAVLLIGVVAPDYWSLPLDMAAAVIVATTLIYIVRLGRWHRLCEAQRVYERLCKTLDTPAAARAKRFKVKGWHRATPVDVMIQPGPGFQLGDKAAEADAALLFGRAIDCADVMVDRAPRGWLRLRATEPTDTAHEPEDAPTQDTPDRALTDAQTRVLSRIKDALFGVIREGGLVVGVTDWWDDGVAPRAISVQYDAVATRAMREVRADIPTVLGDAFPPCARNGKWLIEWDPARDQFVARDVPDPLNPVVPLAPIDPEPDLFTRGLLLGIREDGGEWRQIILGGHIYLAGATGAGKGSVLWGIVRGLLPLIHDGRCLLYVCDPKGGMELGVLRPVAHRFALGGGARALLEEAARDMEDQARRLAAARVRELRAPTREFPVRVVLVDEIGAPAIAGDKEAAAHLTTLLQQGRAPGVCVIGALQDPRIKGLDVRPLFKHAIALRLKERSHVDMVLGAGARTEGARCDQIPKALPGVGFVASDDEADVVRVRAAYVSDEDLAELFPEDPPEHTPRPDTEQLALDPPEFHRIAPHVRVTREDVGIPSEPASELAVANDAPSLVRVADLPLRTRWILPDDVEPVTIFGNEPDPDEPDDRVELTYIYDGEHQERVASFERTDLATPV